MSKNITRLQGFSHKFLTRLFVWRSDGSVIRKISVSGRGEKTRAGSTVGSLGAKGYLHVMVQGKFILIHRLVYFLAHKHAPAIIDHRDGNKTNNRLLNLRAASMRQNMGNFSRPSHNTSGFRGVSKNTRSGMWHAQIKINGKQTYLGRFSTPEEAARCYDRAAKRHFGEFARVNYAH